MKRIYLAAAILLIALFTITSCAKKRLIINDEIGVILPEQRDSLENLIQKFEERTGSQIGVYIFLALEGRVLDDVSKSAFKNSGLAENKNNEGILITMAMQDRQMKMEVGSNLKELLPDERCEEIILKTMLPHYIRGRLFDGLTAGVNELIGIIESHKTAAKQESK